MTNRSEGLWEWGHAKRFIIKLNDRVRIKKEITTVKFTQAKGCQVGMSSGEDKLSWWKDLKLRLYKVSEKTEIANLEDLLQNGCLFSNKEKLLHQGRIPFVHCILLCGARLLGGIFQSNIIKYSNQLNCLKMEYSASLIRVLCSYIYSKSD